MVVTVYLPQVGSWYRHINTGAHVVVMRVDSFPNRQPVALVGLPGTTPAQSYWEFGDFRRDFERCN